MINENAIEDQLYSKFNLNVEISYDETNMKVMKKTIMSTSIPIVDKTTTLDESNENKNKKIELAQYLSKSFVNDGSVSIEIINDGVNVWTI